jgi:hypothetical protein
MDQIEKQNDKEEYVINSPQMMIKIYLRLFSIWFICQRCQQDIMRRGMKGLMNMKN